MAGSVNKVILIGNLGNDPEIRSFQNGGRVANLSIATSESWKDKNTGERRDKTEWHRVVIFNEGLVKLSESYLKKGSKVYIEGQLETRKYEQNGDTKYTTEVVLRPYRGELTMLDGRSDNSSMGGNNNNNNNYNQQPAQQQQQQNTASNNTPMGAPPVDDLEDEIPF